MATFLATDQKPTFVEQYNRSCFLFEHRLHEHAIFDLPNLIELSKRLPDSYWSTSGSAIGNGWDGASHARRSLPETVAAIAESDSLVLLKGLASDPEFGSIYRTVFEEIEQQVGDALRADVAVGHATLVISSPQRITPYHIDAEVNFLFQLRGTKLVNIFDHLDRTLLTDEELEAFYSGDASGAKYKAERQNDAHVFNFQPGEGLHLPLHAPHWTRNEDSVSVALSVNCSLRSNASAAQVYRFNRLLRRRGFSPQVPGVCGWKDRLKVVAGNGVEYARGLRRANKLKPSAPRAAQNV